MTLCWLGLELKRLGTAARGFDDDFEAKEAYWIVASVARFLPIIRTSLPINPAYSIVIPSRLNSLGW